jgi:transposase
MRPKPADQTKVSTGRAVKDNRRATRRHFPAEDKIWIVPEGWRGGSGMAELYRNDGRHEQMWHCCLHE